jgi:hypothetical protein
MPCEYLILFLMQLLKHLQICMWKQLSSGSVGSVRKWKQVCDVVIRTQLHFLQPVGRSSSCLPQLAVVVLNSAYSVWVVHSPLAFLFSPGLSVRRGYSNLKWLQSYYFKECTYRTKTFIRVFGLIFHKIFVRAAALVSVPPILRLYVSLYSIDTQERVLFMIISNRMQQLNEFLSNGSEVRIKNIQQLYKIHDNVELC